MFHRLVMELKWRSAKDSWFNIFFWYTVVQTWLGVLALLDMLLGFEVNWWAFLIPTMVYVPCWIIHKLLFR